ncbi:DUF192 domain-containing protein [Variovorax sp. PAMC 28711]|uniref:DUF192 domain-containing protein n=1 Tax=Variovorax sp. PAMC 28711 TaxID=1795631 RepID=UPI00078CA8B1|nr:DUF192 domain-containing protein [Variovorax sp. PAMC 28711]AMM24612.1 hypothetical protein AX767_09810 [Variovorax sp. PAMC 28711]
MASSGPDPLLHLPMVALSRDGVALPLKVRIANTFLSRLRGLLGVRLSPDAGLYIVPCSSIHMWGMRVTLDVIFVDRAGEILRVCEVRPWQLKSVSRAHAVLECATGTAKRLGLAPGQRLLPVPTAAPLFGEHA